MGVAHTEREVIKLAFKRFDRRVKVANARHDPGRVTIRVLNGLVDPARINIALADALRIVESSTGLDDFGVFWDQLCDKAY
jgi:hypothetical protein